MKFKDMSKEEKLALCEAVIDGKRIEWYNIQHDEWETDTDESLTFCTHLTYRIAPEKPSINWDHVAPEFKWLAVDADGIASLFEEEPTFIKYRWSLVNWVEATPFASFKPGNCAPEDSLVERPE